MKFQAIKGVRDILPPESALWNRVEQAAREVFRTYGYGEIRLPIFEPTELFARSVGLDTDIVSKEMYTFQDKPIDLPEPMVTTSLDAYLQILEDGMRRGDIPSTESNRSALEFVRQTSAQKSAINNEIRERTYETKEELVDKVLDEERLLLGVLLTLSRLQLGENVSLRPEATASVVRAYIEHGMHTRPGNVKLYYMGPMFRRERPQKGRYRQFYQIGAELLGPSDHPALDAEVIEMLMAFFARVKLAGHDALSSIPSATRIAGRHTSKRLREELRKVRDQLGAGQPAAHRDESAARAGFEAAARSRPSSRRCRASPIIFATPAGNITRS